MSRKRDAQREYMRSWRAKNIDRLRVIERERARQRRAASPEKHRAAARNYQRAMRLRRYGTTDAEVRARLVEQGGRCAICQAPIEIRDRNDRTGAAQVDHCHKNGGLRGLLCTGCNTSVGGLGDDEAGILRALAYVRGRRFEPGLGEGLV